ncbi:MAG: cytochrome b/b6 domain-containing protein [Coriobacteriia bacterium]|nr:cytochrome b/b6 domain-containing protein [Coriobacteriia bacterium]
MATEKTIRYIARHDIFKRIWHWSNIVFAFLLLISGLILFIDPIGHSVPKLGLQVAGVWHRIFAVSWMSVYVVTFICRPSNLINSFKHIFHAWDDDDKEFMAKFFPYMANPKNVHLPKQGFTKSGQRISDAAMYLIIFGFMISGILIWMGPDAIGVTAFSFFLFCHDLCTFGFSILIFIHIYLGAGIIPSYTPRAAGWILGNGYVRESDALYHWGHWAEDELNAEVNVVEVPEGSQPGQALKIVDIYKEGLGPEHEESSK